VVEQLILYMEMVDGLESCFASVALPTFTAACTRRSIRCESRLVSAEGPEASGEALRLKRLSICSRSIGHIPVASKDLCTSGFVKKAFQDSQNNGKKSPYVLVPTYGCVGGGW
jgi:hypothetical protein